MDLAITLLRAVVTTSASYGVGKLFDKIVKDLRK